MEKSASRRILDAAYQVLADDGSRGATVRRIEQAAGLPHGSVRHHFGSQAGLFEALVDDLIADDRARLPEPPDVMLARMLGPDRARTVARYELFLLAARDEPLRRRVVAARDSLVAMAEQAGYAAGPARALVAAVDGLILDGVLRGDAGIDPSALIDLVRERPDR